MKNSTDSHNSWEAWRTLVMITLQILGKHEELCRLAQFLGSMKNSTDSQFMGSMKNTGDDYTTDSHNSWWVSTGVKDMTMLSAFSQAILCSMAPWGCGSPHPHPQHHHRTSEKKVTHTHQKGLPAPPSMSSIDMPSMRSSHHLALLPGTRPFQSVGSNLVRRDARYISDTAMISDSHCRHRVVHRLQ